MKKIEFEFTTKYGAYKDAIYADDDVTDDEIETMKLDRLNSWLSIIENPPAEIIADTIEIDGVLYQKVI